MRFRFGTWVFAGLLLSLSLGLYGAHRFQSEEPADSIAHLRLGAGQMGDTALFAQAMARLEERLAKYPDDPEASLLKGILSFKAGRFAEAEEELGRLTRRAPKFHLAHLVYGDLLMARTHPLGDLGAAPLFRSSPRGLDGLRDEAEARLKAYLETLPQDRLPRSLLALDDDVRTAIVVDKSNHRLYVYEYAGPDAPPRLLRDHYVSTGKLIGNKSLRGDLRTPEGVYFVTGYIPDRKLPDKYGVGAYPVNYPNELDRRLGKTGDGIWLHGTERAYYSRPPLDSEGCVVLPNPDLLALDAYLDPGVTPVVITERVQWLAQDEWLALRNDILGALEAWRADWESGDVERYLSHYSPAFWSKGYDAESWAARKRQVARGKEYQHVRLDDVSIFAYPETASDGRELVVINLRQDYRSNNFNSTMGKRLYLAREDGRWKVLYEGGR
jgi:murein L,D-transpeptidase YafK